MMRRLSSFARLASILIAASVVPAVAHAQDRNATADALFDQGHQLFEQKHYAEACPKFQESFRLDPATGSLLALAACHEAEGKLASAWSEYNDTVARARADGRNDRADAAQQRAAALEPKLAKITIVLAPGANEIVGLEVKRDGIVLGAGAYGSPLPVDKGEHTIEASAPGYQPWAGRGTLVDGASESVVIPKLLPAAVSGGKPDESSSKWSTLRTVGVITGAAGVVVIGIGGYFGIHAIGKNNDSNSILGGPNGCVGDVCQGAGKQSRLDAVSAGNTSTALFVVGGILAAGGVALFILGGSSPASDSKPAVAATPAVGPGTAGFALTGRF